MDDDSRRQQNVDKALAAFQKGEGILLPEEQAQEQQQQQQNNQVQEVIRRKAIRKSKFAEEKQFKCELCDLSYHFRQGLHRHKQSVLHKRRERWQRKPSIKFKCRTL